MRRTRALIVVVAMALALAACGGGGTGGGGGGGGGGARELPPVGVVAFGTGLNPDTLALENNSATQKAGSPIFAVGRFLAATAPGDLTVQIQRLGSTIARLPVTGDQPSDAFAIELTGQNLGPGSYLVNFVDNNRRTLASGNLTLQP